MPNSQQSENEQKESFTGYKTVCESARFACDFAHLTQPKIQNHHPKAKTIFFKYLILSHFVYSIKPSPNFVFTNTKQQNILDINWNFCFRSSESLGIKGLE